jgi:membrane protein
LSVVRFLLFCIDTTNEFLGRNCPFIAGAIAFYTLFSLFPLILGIVSVLSFFGPSSEQEQAKLVESIAAVLPVSSDYIGQQIQSVVRTRAITGVFSFLVLVWASSTAFGAIRKGINAAWGIRKTRPYLKERLIDITLVFGAGIVVVIILFSTAAIGVLREVVQALDPQAQGISPGIWQWLSGLITPVISFITFVVLYVFIPNTGVKFRDAWPGALVASVAFYAANWGFVWYVTTYGPTTYNLLYGSIGGVVALLTWAYLSSIIVLLGALITSKYTSYSADIQDGPDRLYLLWTGFTRVRLRIVESSEMA